MTITRLVLATVLLASTVTLSGCMTVAESAAVLAGQLIYEESMKPDKFKPGPQPQHDPNPAKDEAP